MAKIEKPKARKEYKCSKCGEVIKDSLREEIESAISCLDY